MIKVYSAVNQESRERDKKRNRVVLEIGERKWHLSQSEVRTLIKQLKKQKVK